MYVTGIPNIGDVLPFPPHHRLCGILNRIYMLKSSAWDPSGGLQFVYCTEGDLIRREGLLEEPPDHFSGVISVVLGGNQIVFRAIQGILQSDSPIWEEGSVQVRLEGGVDPV